MFDPYHQSVDIVVLSLNENFDAQFFLKITFYVHVMIALNKRDTHTTLTQFAQRAHQVFKFISEILVRTHPEIKDIAQQKQMNLFGIFVL
ncbi:hypothetical protein D3C87_1681770 [compost metagenome]